MRAELSIIIGLVLFIFLIDGLLYFNLRKFFKQKKFPTLLNLFFWLIPILFSGILIAFFVENSTNISESKYYTFTIFNGLFAIIYVPKLVFIVYGIIYAIIIKIVSLLSWKKKPNNTSPNSKENKITRAQFLGKAGAIVAAAPFFSLVYGMTKGRFDYYLKNVELNFKNLPIAFDGLKIIQISDIHLGNYNKEYHRLHEVTKLINQQQPDLIVMTGDMVNNFSSETDGWEVVFSNMKARLGKYSILGNHDYGDYSSWNSKFAKNKNFKGILNAYKRFGFQLLRNENIKIEEGRAAINLLGVENWGKPPFPQYGDLQKTMEGTSASDFNILLSHDPDHWEEEVWGKNIALTLAGHTHGMQFGVKWKEKVWSPAKWKYKHWDGLYKYNKQYLYVNKGLGFIGIPIRVGMPPEITVFTLLKG